VGFCTNTMRTQHDRTELVHPSGCRPTGRWADELLEGVAQERFEVACKMRGGTFRPHLSIEGLICSIGGPDLNPTGGQTYPTGGQTYPTGGYEEGSYSSLLGSQATHRRRATMVVTLSSLSLAKVLASLAAIPPPYTRKWSGLLRWRATDKPVRTERRVCRSDRETPIRGRRWLASQQGQQGPK
jgi:hypothetical protein